METSSNRVGIRKHFSPTKASLHYGNLHRKPILRNQDITSIYLYNSLEGMWITLYGSNLKQCRNRQYLEEVKYYIDLPDLISILHGK